MLTDTESRLVATLPLINKITLAFSEFSPEKGVVMSREGVCTVQNSETGKFAKKKVSQGVVLTPHSVRMGKRDGLIFSFFVTSVEQYNKVEMNVNELCEYLPNLYEGLAKAAGFSKDEIARLSQMRDVAEVARLAFARGASDHFYKKFEQAMQDSRSILRDHEEARRHDISGNKHMYGSM